MKLSFFVLSLLGQFRSMNNSHDFKDGAIGFSLFQPLVILLVYLKFPLHVTEPSYQEELALLKKSFLEAAEAAEGEGENAGESLLQLKSKGKAAQEKEEREYKQFVDVSQLHSNH